MGTRDANPWLDPVTAEQIQRRFFPNERQCRGQGRFFLGVEFTKQFAPSLTTVHCNRGGIRGWFLEGRRQDIRFVQMRGTPVTLPLIVFFHPIIVLLLVHVTLTFHDVREKLPLVPLRYACGSLFKTHPSREFTQPCQRTIFLKLGYRMFVFIHEGCNIGPSDTPTVPAPTPNNQTLVLCDVLYVVVPVLCLGRLGERREAERVIGPPCSRFLCFHFFLLFTFYFLLFFSSFFFFFFLFSFFLFFFFFSFLFFFLCFLFLFSFFFLFFFFLFSFFFFRRLHSSCRARVPGAWTPPSQHVHSSLLRCRDASSRARR